MFTEKQVYSITNQMNAIKKDAAARNLEVVFVYENAGNSGLAKSGRPGLSKLIDNIQRPHDFTVILVYDVSRWRRFQDTDGRAYYEHLCRINSVRGGLLR